MRILVQENDAGPPTRPKKTCYNDRLKNAEPNRELMIDGKHQRSLNCLFLIYDKGRIKGYVFGIYVCMLKHAYKVLYHYIKKKNSL